MLPFLAIEKDPFEDFHSLATNSIVVKISEVTGIKALPQHTHEILASFVFFLAFSTLLPLVTPLFYPKYRQLSPRAQHGFDMHVVSHFNAITVCAISFPLFFSEELSTLTSYTPYAGFVAAYNVGYFLWDVWVTTFYFKYEGLSYFAHAATALYVFTQALRPFMFNFAAPFIWFEASTPFVNINWFAVHVPGLIGDKLKLLNGLCLITVFFLCRIVSGPINGYKMFYEAFTSPPEGIPASTLYGILFCYITLVGLNFVWFSKMVKILTKTVRGLKNQRKTD